jgi:tRNA/tmRNA/rRNA uracil-C5-methylase (TrmA/RlmC/RlmD family)
MTPKLKAEELVDKYRTYIRMADKYEYNLSQDEIYLAKQCALIAVNELIIEENNYNNGSFYPSKFWQEVKQEIEKL